MTQCMEWIRALIARDDGITAIEYALLAALIAVAIIGAVSAVGGDVGTIFNLVSTKLGAAM
jgi:pilus assembly protein Flp/PilA